MAQPGYLIVDANVLIDYLSVDIEILSMISRHIGQIHIISIVLREVDALTRDRCNELGFVIVEPTLEQLIESAQKRGRLSPEDHACLIYCRDAEWACITNDRALRRACEDQGTRLLWGLEAMLLLVQGGHLSKDKARATTEAICNGNPFYTDTILRDFLTKLAQIA